MKFRMIMAFAAWLAGTGFLIIFFTQPGQTGIIIGMIFLVSSIVVMIIDASFGKDRQEGLK